MNNVNKKEKNRSFDVTRFAQIKHNELRDLLKNSLRNKEISSSELSSVIKNFSSQYILEKDVNQSERLLDDLVEVSPFLLSFFEVSTIKLDFYENLGDLENLKKTIIEFLDYAWNRKIPFLERKVLDQTIKYFENDIDLKVKIFKLKSLYEDENVLESNLVDILKIVLKLKQKKIKQKFYNELVLCLEDVKQQFKIFEIYQGFCEVLLNFDQKIISKKLFKKLIESLIYMKDVEIKLALFHIVHKSKNYPHLYKIIEKELHSKNLGPGFIKLYDKNLYSDYIKKMTVALTTSSQDTLDEKEITGDIISCELKERASEIQTSSSENRSHLKIVTKKDNPDVSISDFLLSEYSIEDLKNLAVAFIQMSDLKMAIHIFDHVKGRTLTEEDYLKFTYMEGLVYLEQENYWGVIDLCLNTIKNLKEKKDYLAFLYLKAEAFDKLYMTTLAMKTYRKIHDIEPGYRMTEERMRQLGEL